MPLQDLLPLVPEVRCSIEPGSPAVAERQAEALLPSLVAAEQRKAAAPLPLDYDPSAPGARHHFSADGPRRRPLAGLPPAQRLGQGLEGTETILEGHLEGHLEAHSEAPASLPGEAVRSAGLCEAADSSTEALLEANSPEASALEEAGHTPKRSQAEPNAAAGQRSQGAVLSPKAPREARVGRSSLVAQEVRRLAPGAAASALVPQRQASPPRCQRRLSEASLCSSSSTQARLCLPAAFASVNASRCLGQKPSLLPPSPLD